MKGAQAESSDVMIVRIALPDRAVVRFQGILMAEDGLATMRGQRGGTGELELWSTWAQEKVLDEWLDTLPGCLELRVLERYTFEPVATVAIDSVDAPGGTRGAA